MTVSLYLSGGTANASKSASLGGAMSSVALTDGASLFDANRPNTPGISVYRCIYVYTDSVLTDVRAWRFSDTPSSETDIALGWGAAGINQTESSIADQATAPTGVLFTAPAAQSSGPSAGNLAAGQFHALWIRYTAALPSSVPESFSIGIGGAEASLVQVDGEYVEVDGQLEEVYA